MSSLLSDYIFSDTLRYEAHHLLVAPTNEEEPLKLGGTFGAAFLAALLVDTDEGNNRNIRVDTSAEQTDFFLRYEREVRRDDWGTLTAELQLLSDVYIDLATSNIALTDICPNSRLLDLALTLVVNYMRYLVEETFRAHIWEAVPWSAPFPNWLLDAAHVETRRQRYLHTDWTDPVAVTDLAETITYNQSPITNASSSPTFIFENEAAEDIMTRYFQWLWPTYQAMLRETPGAQPKAVKHRNYVVDQETDWRFLQPEIDKLSPDNQLLWAQWMLDWTTFITRQLKPQQPVRFWTDGVDEKRRAQLTRFLRIQEKEWDYYKCLAASVYALRQLGYVRRTCSVTDITRWLAEQLVHDYTEKNRRDQFRKAWNELGRYSEDVRHFVSVLATCGVTRLTPNP